MDNFKNLPSDITSDILSRLPAESILECKLVSKTWNTFVGHPSFRKLHLHRLNHASDAVDSSKLGFFVVDAVEYFFYVEYNDDSKPTQRVRRVNMTSPFVSLFNKFVGWSYNGLVCLAEGQSVYLCNPITREEVFLPEIIADHDIDDWMIWRIGFGYVSSTNEYKVVGIRSLKNSVEVEVYIYTLGSGRGWRNLGKFNFGVELKLGRIACFANGALYWISNTLQVILTFDLAEEKFREHLLPPSLQPGGNLVLKRLGVLDGFLVLTIGTRPRYDEEDEFNDIWLLKKKSEMKEGNEYNQSLDWSKEFKDSNRKGYLAFTNSGGVICYRNNHLDIYDTKTLTLETIWDSDEWFEQVFLHRNTFVSLKELGEEDTETMESDEF